MSFNKILTRTIEDATEMNDTELLDYYKFTCELLIDTRFKLANKQYRSRKGCAAAVEHEIASKHIILGIIASRGLLDKVDASMTGWEF